MESEVKMVPIGELCDFLSGFAFKSEDLKGNSGIPVVKIKNVNNKVVTLEDMQFYPEDKLDSKVSRFLLSDGDVLIAMTGQGSVGRVGRLSKPKETKLLLNQRVGKFIPKRTVACLDYIYYVISSEKYENILFNAASGSGQPNLSPAIIKAIQIPFIPLKDQIVVSQILTKLDKKITLNRQINHTLEQMAQALFKSWFVDFDPVVDNALDAGFFEQDLVFSDELLRRAEARKAERGSANFKPLSEDIRQLFPAAFEKCSEPSLGLGGWVPEGWKHGCISDVARYRTERVNTAELTLDNYISTENMLVDRKGVQPATSLPTVNSVPAYTSGTVLVSNIRPYFKKIWLAKGNGGYSNDVLGFEAKVSGTESYLFNLMYQDTFFDFMMATSKGSKMPRGDKKAILGWDLVVPTLSLRLFFSEKVNDFYTSADSRHHENITLNQLRDTLLPKLISGELRLSVSEVDTAEDVLA